MAAVASHLKFENTLQCKTLNLAKVGRSADGKLCSVKGGKLSPPPIGLVALVTIGLGKPSCGLRRQRDLGERAQGQK